MKIIIFWNVTPCSLLRFLPRDYLLVLAKLFPSTLKMEAICSSETSVASQQTTRRHFPEDDTLFIASVSKGNVSELGFEIINFRRELLLKIIVHYRNAWYLVLSAEFPI
jgi:hypothetical protein